MLTSEISELPALSTLVRCNLPAVARDVFGNSTNSPAEKQPCGPKRTSGNARPGKTNTWFASATFQRQLGFGDWDELDERDCEVNPDELPHGKRVLTSGSFSSLHLCGLLYVAFKTFTPARDGGTVFDAEPQSYLSSSGQAPPLSQHSAFPPSSNQHSHDPRFCF
ncbi:MAG UNVERIFIED_CONTAM: hypothetical protein LVR18_19720 [Planctomycetaceae bacterium]